MTRLEKIKSKQAVIGIVGLGYVGLPLAQAFCQQGIKVVGFDIDQEKIDLIEKGQSYIKHIGDEVIGTMRAGGLFDVTSNFAKIAEVDVIIIDENPSERDDKVDKVELKNKLTINQPQ